MTCTPYMAMNSLASMLASSSTNEGTGEGKPKPPPPPPSPPEPQPIDPGKTKRIDKLTALNIQQRKLVEKRRWLARPREEQPKTSERRRRRRVMAILDPVRPKDPGTDKSIFSYGPQPIDPQTDKNVQSVGAGDLGVWYASPLRVAMMRGGDDDEEREEQPKDGARLL